MVDREALARKLKKRAGKSGFQTNVRLLETVVDLVDHEGSLRDGETGRFVSREFAVANPERVEKVEVD